MAKTAVKTKPKKRASKRKKLKAAVVGYGGAFNMGREHLSRMKDGGMIPTAVCEIDKSRLKVAEEDWPGIQTYTSLDEMLKKSDCDFVTIITPHNTHASLGLKCLKAGKHVCLEKPMAITTAECDRMIAEGKKKRKLVTVYHNRHWDGCILTALRKIKSGVIGDVIRIEAHMGGWGAPRDWWRTSKKISGGIAYDWGVHLLEYSLQILTGDIVEVSGFAHNGYWAKKSVWKKDTNEDEAFGVVRLADGKRITLCMSAIDSKPKDGQLEITGTEGTYVFSGGNYTIITHKDGKKITEEGGAQASEGHKFYRNVNAHLIKGTKLVITPEWARRPIHILDLMCKSAEKNISLKAKYK